MLRGLGISKEASGTAHSWALFCRISFSLLVLTWVAKGIGEHKQDAYTRSPHDYLIALLSHFVKWFLTVNMISSSSLDATSVAFPRARELRLAWDLQMTGNTEYKLLGTLGEIPVDLKHCSVVLRFALLVLRAVGRGEFPQDKPQDFGESLDLIVVVEPNACARLNAVVTDRDPGRWLSQVSFTTGHPISHPVASHTFCRPYSLPGAGEGTRSSIPAALTMVSPMAELKKSTRTTADLPEEQITYDCRWEALTN